MTYINFTCELLQQIPPGMPIYIRQIAEKIANRFALEMKDAAAAASVAVKRIMDGNIIPELRFYQKGIYFRTVVTPFGEREIDRERLIADKYLLPDKGYETGLGLLHRMGLTPQMPKEQVIATNVAGDCARADKKLNIIIRPPKVEVNASNRAYLQALDVLELMGKAPVDAEQPYEIIANFIRENNLLYEKLLFFADRYYNRNTVIQLAHTAGEGETAV